MSVDTPESDEEKAARRSGSRASPGWCRCEGHLSATMSKFTPNITEVVS